MENKRGAPKKPPEKRKGNAVQIRLTEAEREACDTAAIKNGQKLSAWARTVLVRAAKRAAQ